VSSLELRQSIRL